MTLRRLRQHVQTDNDISSARTVLSDFSLYARKLVPSPLGRSLCPVAFGRVLGVNRLHNRLTDGRAKKEQKWVGFMVLPWVN
jgi:hypothetical protein